MKTDLAFSFLLSALAPLPDPILIGVSGGMDSVTLLRAMVEAGRQPIVLHFHHGWRPESAQEAVWVAQLAKQYGLKYFTAKARTSLRAKKSEATARLARWAFFAKIAQKTGMIDIALAHHADDQMETFLLQLFRGSGAAAGMKRVSEQGGLRIHRPWLNVSRQEIQAYAQEQRLTWCEDSSNLDTKFKRNLLRLEVIPYLQQQLGGSVRDNLARAAEIRRAESEWLDALCLPLAQNQTLRVKFLRSVPLGQQRRILWLWLGFHHVADIGFAEVEAIRELLEKDLPAKINLSQGKHVRRRSGLLFLEEQVTGLKSKIKVS